MKNKFKLYLRNLSTIIRLDDIKEIAEVVDKNFSKMLQHVNNHVRIFIETKEKRPIKPFIVAIADEEFNIIVKKVKSKISQPQKPNFDVLLISTQSSGDFNSVIMIITSESYKESLAKDKSQEIVNEKIVNEKIVEQNIKE